MKKFWKFRWLIFHFHFLLPLTAGNESNEELNNLRFVNIIWRGGAHNSEENRTSFLNFPESPGHLTKLGKQELFYIGQVLRKRYGALLNSTYDPFAVRFLAGDQNRSIDSGLMVTAGLFPPREQYEVWNPSLLWQPIAVHVDLRMSQTGGETTVLKKDCPNFDAFTKSEEYLNLNEKWRGLIIYLCNVENYDASCDLVEAYYAAKDLNILAYHMQITNNTGKDFPEWVNDTVIEMAKEFFWDVHELLSSWKNVTKVAAGYILDAMIGEMKDAVKRNTTRRLHGWSTHVGILHSFRKILTDDTFLEWPQFGDFISLELYRAPKNETIVKAFLWNRTSGFFEEMAISNCISNCSLNDFEERSQEWLSDDYKSICGKENSSGDKPSQTTKQSSVLFGLFVSSLLICLTTFFLCMSVTGKVRRLEKESEESQPLFQIKR